MKKISFILMLFCSINLNAQWVSIPDTNFGAWIKLVYPNCMQGSSQLGWQMDTTCSISTVRKLFPVNKNIVDLTGIQYFDSLQMFFANNNLITTIPSLAHLVNLDTLFIGDNELIALPALPPNLKQLVINSNHIDSLPALPAGLKYLSCGVNPISSLPALPSGLQLLSCSQCLLTGLPILPGGLLYLNCSGNQLTVLPALPSTLFELVCDNNLLNFLPTLPNNLTTLSCSYNQISNLPAMPSGLINFYCSFNQISNLPALPNTLETLHCGNNLITSLQPFPPVLASLVCSRNQLTTIPALPSTLKLLSCHNNQLTVLPALPAGLINLSCSNNQISVIPELPDSLYTCYVGDNPLTCLPQLKRIVYLTFNNTMVTCLPNYGTVTNSTPALNAVPLCGMFNNNGCDIFWNISGKTYFDDNSNCLKDGVDLVQQNMKLQLSSGGSLMQQTFSGGEGFYSFDATSLGNYEVGIDTSDIPFYVSCPANNLWNSVLTINDSLDYSKDFALECKQGFDLTARSISSSPFRPGRTTSLAIRAGDLANFYGVYCANGVSGAITVIINGPASYDSPGNGALTPTSVNGNVITYNVADFGTTNWESDFDMYVRTDTNAVLDSTVCITVSATPLSGDYNTANNTLTHCFIVVASFDPNDKQVYPEGDIVDTSSNRWLTYTIRFQNTGNDTAFHIYITDTLDSDLDYSSFQLMAYSHQPIVQVIEDAVRFNFPNIYLPDSFVNEPLSHGYVQYKIKLKDNLQAGTTINNTAFIYFDFNAPVITNTTTNTITTITSTPNKALPVTDIQVFPNPFSQTTTIQFTLAHPANTSLNIYDALGSVIMEIPAAQMDKGTHRVQFENSKGGKGIYIVELTVDGVRTLKRIVNIEN